MMIASPASRRDARSGYALFSFWSMGFQFGLAWFRCDFLEDSLGAKEVYSAERVSGAKDFGIISYLHQNLSQVSLTIADLL